MSKAGVVNGLGKYLFTGTAFAGKQNITIIHCSHTGNINTLHQWCAIADNIIELILSPGSGKTADQAVYPVHVLQHHHAAIYLSIFITAKIT